MKIVTLTVSTLAAVVVIVAAAAAQTAETPAKNSTEIRAIEREIAKKERFASKFASVLRKLKTKGGQSSNSGARKAVEETEGLMAEMIIFEEDKFGEEHLITQHGKEADTVHTSDLTETRGARTNSRRRTELPADTPPAYFRLMRMQEIYVTCRTMREHAIAREGEAGERYFTLVKEFESLLQKDLAELHAQLPQEPEAETDETAGKADN